MKIKMQLLPADVLREAARVLTVSAEKHGDIGNTPHYAFGHACKYLDQYGAIQRHLTDWVLCEGPDAQTNASPLIHALCRVAILAAMERRGVGLDDRDLVAEADAVDLDAEPMLNPRAEDKGDPFANDLERWNRSARASKGWETRRRNARKSARVRK